MKFYYLIFGFLFFSCTSNDLTQNDVDNFIKTQIPANKERTFTDGFGNQTIIRLSDISLDNIEIINIENENNIKTSATISFNEIVSLKAVGNRKANPSYVPTERIMSNFTRKNAECNFEFTKSTDRKWYLKNVNITYGNYNYEDEGKLTRDWEEEIKSKYNRIAIK